MLQPSFTTVISTALVGPNSLFREGLRGILHPPYHAETVAETIDSADSAQQIAEVHLVILIAHTDQTVLLSQVRRVRKQNEIARIVVLSDIGTSDVVWPLLVAGADAYLLRSISLDALRASLDAVMLGATVVLPAARNAFLIEGAEPAFLENGVVECEMPEPNAEVESKKLSDRETEILLCLKRGESNKQIARKCAITEATVKVHLKAILRKIRVSNRTQAAVWAHNNHVTRPLRLSPTVAVNLGHNNRPSIERFVQGSTAVVAGT